MNFFYKVIVLTKLLRTKLISNIKIILLSDLVYFKVVSLQLHWLKIDLLL